MIIKEPVAYRTERTVTWCPGCGDARVLEALCHALSRSGVDPADTVLVTGSGCSSLIGFFVNSYAIQGPYGRTLPIALGVKLANPSLTVIAAGGDGDAYAAGAGHLIHLARKNPDITWLIMDNGCYGLTKGQPSPTARNGVAGATTVDRTSLNPMTLLIAAGATYVAQGSSDEPELLIRLMEEAFRHRGFSVINIFSPCAVFDGHPSAHPPGTPEVARPEVIRIDPATHASHDHMAALQLAALCDGRRRVGLFYREERDASSGGPERAQRDGYDDLVGLERIMNGSRP
jgi:2-oxoglutarate/2-oxoacid ferredoxin oxidoreductase subunit beta